MPAPRKIEMEHQLEPSTEVRLLVEPSWCAGASCNATAAIDFEGRSLCLDHFLPACIHELEARNELLRNLPFDAAATEEFKAFVTNCAQQAEKLAAKLEEGTAEDLNEDSRLTRAQAKTSLLDFLLRISRLTQQIRRSPRVTSSIAVWLRREDPHQTWHEETWTVSTSRHGAALLCRRPVEKGGTVVLCRKDKGSRATAQVVYSRRDDEGRKQIGIEFCDPVDFWDRG
ncbi:MAG: PilZ domain-containing protein [Candidatus Acidiferrales bacterium]|jgi:PilZ domain-containing protein